MIVGTSGETADQAIPILILRFFMTLFAFWRIFDCLYAIPLILATGMVYSASRHEDIHDVLRHGLRLSGWIFGFMLMVLVVMMILF